MKVTLLQIDKTNELYLNEGIDIYLKRLKNYSSFGIATINVPKAVRMRPEKEQKTEEARLIQKWLADSDFVVLLDENGKLLDSVEFSKFIQQKALQNVKHLVFIIGGPYGFDDWVYKRADFRLSLSKMTFSHQMVRLFFVEQLYRGFSILKGEKYHHF
ncbi:MAG: 23S rRNA (pseudouridine(1915)-N(3))-methyltransferase RlmH [Bacteroidia bacterium]